MNPSERLIHRLGVKICNFANGNRACQCASKPRLCVETEKSAREFVRLVHTSLDGHDVEHQSSFTTRNFDVV